MIFFKFITLTEIITAAALCALPLVYPNDYLIYLLVLTWIYAMLSLGLNLLLGYGGQICLGQAAFFGIGAYTSALLTTELGLPAVLAFVASVFLTALVAFIIGLPILRLRGFFLALATLGFGEIFHVFVNETRSLTNGPTGIAGIPWFSIFGFEFDTYLRFYYLSLFFLMFQIVFSKNIMHSHIGRILRSISLSETASATLGVDIHRMKLSVFVLAEAYAGAAGSLYAFFISAIGPPSFTTWFSILVVMMVIIGGMGKLYGSVAGAAFVVLVSEFLGAYQEYYLSFYGVLIILILIAIHKGMFEKTKKYIIRSFSVTQKRG